MFPCGRIIERPLNRRQMLTRCASGFGGVALSALLADDRLALGADQATQSRRLDPFAPRDSHFPPRARNVIFLYMDGGPSQVESFDPKPRLDRDNGKPFAMEIDKRTLQFNNMGNTLGSLKIQNHANRVFMLSGGVRGHLDLLFSNFMKEMGWGRIGPPRDLPRRGASIRAAVALSFLRVLGDSRSYPASFSFRESGRGRSGRPPSSIPREAPRFALARPLWVLSLIPIGLGMPARG